MGAPSQQRNFADTGLDFSVADRFTAEERKNLLAWYRDTHGKGGLDLVPFAPFLIENLPSAFKLSRQHLITVPKPRNGVVLPDMATILFYLHTYTAMANPKGILYEIINAREAGAPKALVLDVLNYAYLTSGARGMNAAGEMSAEYMRDWADNEKHGKKFKWPKGWAPDPKAFHSGINLNSSELPPEELRMISEWHQRMHGVVPRHVELFGRLHPEAYKVQRIRYEKSIGKTMPAQLAPLMTLHLAAHYLWTGVMRQAIHQARVLGARRHHVVHTLLMGLRQSIDPMVMEVVADEVGDLLAGWTE
jgi:hypothetical protein